MAARVADGGVGGFSTRPTAPYVERPVEFRPGYTSRKRLAANAEPIIPTSTPAITVTNTTVVN